jgi:hypothetical protein
MSSGSVMKDEAHALAYSHRGASVEAKLISYDTLRTAVGVLGVTFPVLLFAGDCLWQGRIAFLPSISAYYGSKMHDEFVGVLFAIGLFMFSYRGYDRGDDIAGHVASVLAILVALFPTTSLTPWVSHLHLVFAALLFFTFAYFSAVLFTLPRDTTHHTAEKQRRNRVYVACGVAIVASIVAIGLYKLLVVLHVTREMSPDPTFFMETLALWAFGISWATKGETFPFLFPDRTKVRGAGAL